MHPAASFASILAGVVLLIAFGLLLAGRLGWLQGTAPGDLGVREGRLKPPSPTANSVSSQAVLYPDHPQARSAAIEPFGYTGDGTAAMARLAGVVERRPQTRIVDRDARYLRAESTTPLLRFTDDIEFWLDERNQVIQVRSASRIGRGDLGANRRRVESLRAAFGP